MPRKASKASKASKANESTPDVWDIPTFHHFFPCGKVDIPLDLFMTQCTFYVLLCGNVEMNDENTEKVRTLLTPIWKLIGNNTDCHPRVQTCYAETAKEMRQHLRDALSEYYRYVQELEGMVCPTVVSDFEIFISDVFQYASKSGKFPSFSEICAYIPHITELYEDAWYDALGDDMDSDERGCFDHPICSDKIIRPHQQSATFSHLSFHVYCHKSHLEELKEMTKEYYDTESSFQPEDLKDTNIVLYEQWKSWKDSDSELYSHKEMKKNGKQSKKLRKEHKNKKDRDLLIAY